MDSETKYHILVIIRWPVGGIRTFIKYVYRCFDPSRYRFTLLLPEYAEHKVLVDDLKSMNPDYKTLRPDFSVLEFYFSLLRILKSEKVDLVHSHGLTAGILCAVPARVRRIPHLLTLHEQLYDNDLSGFIGIIKKQLLNILLSLIDAIHVVSNDARDNLLKQFPNLERGRTEIITIRSGIDVSSFSGSARRDLRAELNLPKDTFLIGFLGRFMPVKGFKYLIEALEYLVKDRNGGKKTPVVITFGWGAYIREEMDEVERKGLKNYVISLPFTSDLATTLRGLDLVAMPSLYEACPLLAMEAMVAGVPVIGTDCSGLRDILKDTPSVMVPAYDGYSFAQAIRKEIINPSKEIAHGFRQTASNTFDITNTVRELEKVILRISEEKVSGNSE
jgi:glycosyltransferase involved in cell wall biosynthesis